MIIIYGRDRLCLDQLKSYKVACEAGGCMISGLKLRETKRVTAFASVQQKLRYGNRPGVLMHKRQGACVHEDSSHVAIPSVDSIILSQQLTCHTCAAAAN